MKNNWKNSFLTDIANISTGKWDANHATENGKYRFYTCAYDYLLCDTKRFQGECLILPGNGVNVGEVFYYEGEFDAYQRTYVISDIKIFPKYLHYHMLLYWKVLGVKKQYGSATNFIKIGNFKDYEVQFPPLSEQKRIVAILDEAFEAIARAKEHTEQTLKNAKEIFESYLQGVFENKGDDWGEKKLGEVYDVRDGTHDSPEYYNEGYALITSKNLKNGGLIFDDIKFISEDDYININKRSKVDIGDVLFAMIGTIGNPVVIKDMPNYAIKNVALFKVGQNQNSYFLKYFLDSKQTINKMMLDAKGTTQKFVGLGYLRNFPILVPSLKEQQVIVRKLDALRVETQKLEAIYTQKLSDLEELKKSLLQKAFAGELVK